MKMTNACTLEDKIPKILSFSAHAYEICYFCMIFSRLSLNLKFLLQYTSMDALWMCIVLIFLECVSIFF